MEKKIYADYHGPRCTRECDGEVAQWKYYGTAKKSRAAQTYANHNADFILKSVLTGVMPGIFTRGLKSSIKMR